MLSWDGADTLSALREVTGNEFGAPAEMLDRLSEGGLVPAADPALQAAIDRRLADRLSALGAEGWEAFWVREGETQLEGHLVPSPSVLLKRRR